MTETEAKLTSILEVTYDYGRATDIDMSQLAKNQYRFRKLADALDEFIQYIELRKISKLTKYKYYALNAGEIRILELVPAQNAKILRLQGRIHTISIEGLNRPSYDCVSYAWGAPIMDHDIIILDHGSDDIIGRVPVTKSLYSALLRFRSKKETRQLWIDQVCIDQRNIIERGAQVGMMKQIYTAARKTIAWLGEPRGTNDIELIEEVAQVLKGLDLTKAQLLDKSSILKKKYPRIKAIQSAQFEVAQEEHDEQAFAKHAPFDMVPRNIQFNLSRWQEAVINLLRTSWTRRAWVVQEFVVSPSVLFQYGTLCLSDSTLLRLVRVLHIEHLTPYFNLMYFTFHRRFWQEKGVLGGSITDGSADFITFLHQMQWCTHASDPRDKIFAFIGLKKEANGPEASTTYKMPTEKVYIDFASSHVQVVNNLDILALSQSFHNAPDKLRIPNLPSWVPNWHDSTQYQTPFHFPGDRSLFRSARGSPHQHITAGKPIELITRGKEIGRITNIYQTAFRRSNSILDFAADLAELFTELNVSVVDLDKRHVVLRTLLADGRYGAIQPIPYDISEIYELCSSAGRYIQCPITDDDNDLESLLKYLSESVAAVWDRDLLEIESIDGRRFGLGDQHFQHDDVICILHGSCVPIALRQASEVGVDRWTVVGQCYVDGWMYGHYPLPAFWDAFENAPDEFVLV